MNFCDEMYSPRSLQWWSRISVLGSGRSEEPVPEMLRPRIISGLVTDKSYLDQISYVDVEHHSTSRHMRITTSGKIQDGGDRHL